MPARFRHTDVSWRGLGDGKLRVKWGSGWVAPSLMYVKWGGWIDSGYRGLPAIPVGVHVNYWDYNEVRIGWSAGSGGAPVAAWHVVQTDQWGNWLRQYEFGGSPSPPGYFPVSQDGRYRFYVRSKGSTGLYSADWAPSVGAQIGHAAVTTYTTETATRPFNVSVSVNGYKDAIVGAAVYSHQAVQSVTYQIYANNGFTSVLSPYNNREIYRIGNSGQGERFTWNAGSVNYNLDVGDYWGNGGITGMICRGAGWAAGPSSSIYRAVGTIIVYGYEMYNYQQAHTSPAVGNSYW